VSVEPEVAFGRVLRKLRKSHELSQEALALDAGIERNYVSLLELGQNSASIKIIFKLATALGITVSHFMELTEKEMRGSRKKKED
jgi:transcriptional regulator with XRE-family HTH domain